MSGHSPTNKPLSPKHHNILKKMREESTIAELCILFHPLTPITITNAILGKDLRIATRRILEQRLDEITKQKEESQRARTNQP